MVAGTVFSKKRSAWRELSALRQGAGYNDLLSNKTNHATPEMMLYIQLNHTNSILGSSDQQPASIMRSLDSVHNIY